MEGAGRGEHGGRNKTCSKHEVNWGLAEDTGEEICLWAGGCLCQPVFLTESTKLTGKLRID